MQDAGKADKFEFPRVGPPYFRGSILIHDAALVESSSKSRCP